MPSPSRAVDDPTALLDRVRQVDLDGVDRGAGAVAHHRCQGVLESVDTLAAQVLPKALGGDPGAQLGSLPNRRDVPRQARHRRLNQAADVTFCLAVALKPCNGKALAPDPKLKLVQAGQGGEAHQRGDGGGQMLKGLRLGLRPVAHQGIQLGPMRAYINALPWKAGEHGAQLVNRGGNRLQVGVLGREELPFRESQTKQAHWQGLARMVGLALGLELEIGEVLPVIDDQEVLLHRSAGWVGVLASAPPDHLPELNLAEYRLGKDQILDCRNIHAGVEHVH